MRIPLFPRLAKHSIAFAGLLLGLIVASEPCRAAVTFTKRVSSSSDDAEQRTNGGSMSLTSPDLELVEDGYNSDVTAMRFTNVTIPKGAAITDAYIQFQADETDYGGCSLTIHGQDTDDAPTFTTSNYNITSRSTTSASASWSPTSWNSVGQAGSGQRTPDISSIIQEIVNRSGWSSGNDLVVIFTGSGTRTAESYDGSSSAAPLLHIDYVTSAHWKLNETSGNTAADAMGGNNGTVTGTATWTSGVLNNGFSFNGSTKIQTSGLIGSPANVTVAAWANLTTADTNGAEIISLGDRFGLRLDDGSVSGAFFWSGSSYVWVTVSNKYAGSGWHHFAATFDDAANAFTLYIDGAVAATLNTTASISYSGGGSNTVIGRHGNSATNRDFTGIIDDVRVYGSVLTANEIAELYGLVGHWKLSETSGTTAADSTIFAKNATVSGGANWSSDCGGTGAFDFNGSQYLSTTNSSHLQPTGMLSIAAWIKGDSWGSGTDNDVILRKGEDNPNNYALAISDGHVELLLDGNDSSGIRSTTTLSTGVWYHVAATWDGVTVKIYIDGQLDSSTAHSGTIGTDTRPLYIGGRSARDYFDGMIRDVRLYNRPLTAAELQALSSGLVGHWKFAEGSGTSAADSSSLVNHATLSGGATWTSDCAGNNNALLTNGTGGIAQTARPVTPPDVGTVAFWMRSTGAPAGTARILGLGGDWEIRQGNDGRIISDLCGDGSTTIGTVTPLSEVGQWYHVAVTFDSADDSYAIYVDGQLELSGTNPNNLVQQPAGILSFGTRTGSTEYWAGALRDVRIYNRQLCPLEIAALYGEGGHWKLDETSGSVAADSSGQGRHGTVVGTPNWTTGQVDNCLQLNGATTVQINSLMGSPKNVTMAAWANLTAKDSGGAELVSIGDYFAIRLDEGSTSRAFFYNGSSWDGVGISQTFLGTGWHHFAAVFNDDQNYCKLFVDGVEAASVNTTVTIPYTGLGTNVVIGGTGTAGQSGISPARSTTCESIAALCPTDIQALHDMGSGSFGGVKIIKWVEIQ